MAPNAALFPEEWWRRNTHHPFGFHFEKHHLVANALVLSKEVLSRRKSYYTFTVVLKMIPNDWSHMHAESQMFNNSQAHYLFPMQRRSRHTNRRSIRLNLVKQTASLLLEISSAQNLRFYTTSGYPGGPLKISVCHGTERMCRGDRAGPRENRESICVTLW